MREALRCRNSQVLMVGGAKSAGQAAMYLAEYAAKVLLLVRGPTFKGTMSSYLYDRILTHPKIDVQFNTEVTDLQGDNALARIGLTDVNSKVTKWIEASRLFACIGGLPNTKWAKDTPHVPDASRVLI